MKVILSSLCGALAIGAIAWMGNGALVRRAEFVASREQYTQTADQLVELTSLRTRRPSFIAADVPDEDLTRRVTRAINAAGLSTSILGSVLPDSDQPASAARAEGGKPLYLRRSAHLTLDSVTLPQLGRFLEVWRSAEQGWMVSSIDLAASSGIDGGLRTKSAAGHAASSGRDLPLRALLTIEAITAAEPPPSSPPPAGASNP